MLILCDYVKGSLAHFCYWDSETSFSQMMVQRFRMSWLTLLGGVLCHKFSLMHSTLEAQMVSFFLSKNKNYHFPCSHKI